MSTDTPTDAGDAPAVHPPTPEAVESRVEFTPADAEARAVHTTPLGNRTAEVVRVYETDGEGILETVRWRLDGDVVREEATAFGRGDAIGSDGAALTMEGFVVERHYETNPCEQFEPFVRAISHDAF